MGPVKYRDSERGVLSLDEVLYRSYLFAYQIAQIVRVPDSVRQIDIDIDPLQLPLGSTYFKQSTPYFSLSFHQ